MTLIYIGKVWQSKSFCLCFEINEKNLSKKAYLHIHNKKIFLDPKKPTDLILTGQVANLLRKYLSGKILTSIQKIADDFWFFFQKRGENEASFYIRMKPKLGGEVSLITKEDNKIIFRYSSKGTYTRIKIFEELFPDERKDENLLSSFLEEIKNKLSSKDRTKIDENKELEDKSPLQQELNKKIKRKLKTLRTSLSKLKEQCFTAEDLDKLSEKALQLQNHLYLVKHGQKELKLDTEQGFPESLIIELDETKNPGQNLALYFKEIDKKKKAFVINAKRLHELETNINSLEVKKNELGRKNFTTEDLQQIGESLGLSQKQDSPKKVSNDRLPYKLFVDNQGVKYFVGKAAKDSDALVKKAKSQDLWFHVVGSTGSHVIVPYSSVKKIKDLEAIKKTAAILALYYSKKKNDKAGEVYHAPRRTISKKKSQAPGLWTIDNARSFYVSYDEDDLKNVLNFMT